MNDESDSRMVRLPVRDMRDETKPQCPMCGDMGGPEYWSKCKAVTCEMRAAQEGGLPPLPEPDYRFEDPEGEAPDIHAWGEKKLREYARTAIAAAGGGVPQGTAEKADEMLLGIHRHLQEALRIPTMPWPDPGAHGHEATARAIHTSYCALRFKVMDAIAELTGARVELTGLLASTPVKEEAMAEEQEALRLADLLMRDVGDQLVNRKQAAAMLRKLVAEREADRAAMRQALGVICALCDPSHPLITDLRQRLEGTT